VFDLISKLFGKRRARGLTAAEAEELVRASVAQIVDPLENPPPGFVSKHSFAPRDISAKVQAIDWFSECGSPLTLDLSMRVEQVSEWPQAMAICSDDFWSDIKLEAQNQLTLWLHLNARDKYQRWNDLVRGFKTSVENPLTEKEWEPYRQRHDLPAAVIDSVQWDVLGAFMENAYLETGHRCFFFLDLLSVDEAGHFPCGWVGEWPQGTLLVY
jgi:hypothetical protein